MEMKEWKKVKNYSYLQYVNYLNNKYGAVTDSYYKYNKAGKFVACRPQKKGLIVHHVREDVVANLCDKTIALTNPIEYQQPENLVYCDLLEHLFLHILITENLSVDNFEELGLNGCKWIAANINQSIINKDNKIKKTVYLELVNRFCTSSYIRQRQSQTPERLLQIIMNNKLPKDFKTKMLKSAKDTCLFDWNLSCQSQLLNYFREGYRTAIINICTGGGKTSTAMEYLRISGCRGLVLSPSNTIKNGTWQEQIDKYGANIEIVNYQTFMNCYKTYDYSKFGVVICDEAHHIDAPRWGEGIQYILDNTDLKIIGLTATTTIEQKMGLDKYFGKRICYGLNLADGIKNGDIQPFSYVSAIYKLDHADFDKYGELGQLYYGKLNLKLSEEPIYMIMRKNMPNKNPRKIITFVQNQDMIDEAKDIMIKYNPNFASEDYMRIIHSGLDKKYVEEAKKWFNEKHDTDVCLITINMANEGAHYEGINTLVMFRKTNSAQLYLQQLGRIVVPSFKDPQDSIVFDFTNNAKALISKRNIAIKRVKTADTFAINENLNDLANEFTNANVDEITLIQDVLKEYAEKQNNESISKPAVCVDKKSNIIIYKDYTEDCAETLLSLQEATNGDNLNARIYVSIDEVAKEFISEEYFDFGLWDNFTTSKADKNNYTLLIGKGANKNKNSINRKKKNNNAESSKNDALADKFTAVQVKASDAQKIAAAFKLCLRRAYNENIISIINDNEIVINDEDKFNLLARRLGFLEPQIIIKAIGDMEKQAFIILKTLDK